MKVSEILELLKRDGWYVARMRGSHRQFKHPGKAGLVTVAGKPADDLAPGTLNSILKQAASRNERLFHALCSGDRGRWDEFFGVRTGSSWLCRHGIDRDRD